MTKDEALKLALEALEDLQSLDSQDVWLDRWSEAITAIKEALAQPEQEAVGSVVTYYDSLTHGWFGDPPPEGTLLYIVPPQPEERPWVGLTDEERLRVLQFIDPKAVRFPLGFKQIAESIERLLKEKNT